MHATYWDDIALGATITSAARTITEADIVSFAGLSGDYNPIHTDAEFARTTIYGARIAHGLLGLAIGSGLLSQTSALGATTIAFLGINSWTFRAPIRIGDTIRARTTISDKRATSKPDRGILTQQVELLNQRDEIVQRGEFVVMIQRRPTTHD